MGLLCILRVTPYGCECELYPFYVLLRLLALCAYNWACNDVKQGEVYTLSLMCAYPDMMR